MIRNFSDHSANERTFLAWVRTAVAVMAFGFVVEKFGLFLQTIAATAGGHLSPSRTLRFSGVVGLALIALGVAVVGLAAARFLRTAREIDSAEEHAGPGSRFDLTLAALLVLVGGALLAYLSLNLFGVS